MNILPRINIVLAAEPNEAQLDKYISDLRESLASSNKQFITYPLLTITALVLYHLVIYEGAKGLSFNSIQVAGEMFRKVFLIVPAALLYAATCVGYLRRCQREVYDYLSISRCRVLGATGLHELRLPADHILGNFLLRTEGGAIGKIVSTVGSFLSTSIFVVWPVFYVVYASAENIALFGVTDMLVITVSSIVILLSTCSLAIVFLAGRVKAT